MRGTPWRDLSPAWFETHSPYRDPPEPPDDDEPGVYVIRPRMVCVCIPCDEKDHENCYGERCQCCRLEGSWE